METASKASLGDRRLGKARSHGCRGRFQTAKLQRAEKTARSCDSQCVEQQGHTENKEIEEFAWIP